MNKILKSELTKLEDYEFLTLEHHVQFARLVRNIMSQNAIDEKTMATKLEIPVKRMKEIINASYPFDLRLISKIQAYNQEIASNNAKFKVEAESIGFTTYKLQYPLYVEKIERLLNILEKQNPTP